MKNVSTISDCYGCGICAIACPKQIISIKLNAGGFYQPYIDNWDSCINCGVCVDVCAYSYDVLSVDNTVLASYAAWSRTPAVRCKCSSGGVGFELGKAMLQNGYEVCGVRYNANQNRAEHYMATTIEELAPSMGSKYIQSYTVDGLRQVYRQSKYLITGTPCQIDSFRRYIKRCRLPEDNFVLMDFFCHGVPSRLLWDKYVAFVEKITGKVVYASWRNKRIGWHDSCGMTVDGEEKAEKVDWHDSYNVLIMGNKNFYNSRLSEGDPFYSLFFSNCCLGKACYHRCKYKYDQSAADIRIGDLWGTKYSQNEDGVSAVIVFTKKGKEALSWADCVLEKEPLEVVAEGQMNEKLEMPSIRSKVLSMLLDDSVELNKIKNRVKIYQLAGRLKYYCMHPGYMINRLRTKLIGR